jgi:uncharacterized membrane protein
MKRLLNLLIVVISVIYPLMVYFSIQDLSPVFFSLLIAGLALVKFAISPDKTSKHELSLLIASLACALFIAFSKNEYSIKLYPVIISCFVGGLFALSLLDKESFIERLARMRGKTISCHAKIYTRRLTIIWSLLLFINAMIALYLAYYATTESWVLYCGLLSYVFFGCFILAELIYRRHYIAKYES